MLWWRREGVISSRLSLAARNSDRRRYPMKPYLWIDQQKTPNWQFKAVLRNSCFSVALVTGYAWSCPWWATQGHLFIRSWPSLLRSRTMISQKTSQGNPFRWVSSPIDTATQAARSQRRTRPTVRIWVNFRPTFLAYKARARGLHVGLHAPIRPGWAHKGAGLALGWAWL